MATLFLFFPTFFFVLGTCLNFFTSYLGPVSLHIWVLVLLFHFIFGYCLTFSLHGSLYYEDHVVTSRLPFDATAQQVKDALEALSNIGKGGLLRVERNQGKVPRLFKVHLKVHIER